MKKGISFYLLSGVAVICVTALTVLSIFAIIALFSGYFYSGTEIKHELWIAKEEISVYGPMNKLNNTELFKLSENDTCTPMREFIEKDTMYIKILCREGEGWIESGRKFDVLKARKN